MSFKHVKIVSFILLVGLLSACGSAAAPSATSAPIEEAAPTTTVPTDLPPATDTAASTEAPATEPIAATEPAAATQPPAQSGATVSFASDVLPILQSRCVNCHGGNEVEEGLLMRTYAELMTGSENGLVITPGDSASSLLVELVAAHKMPKRGPKLTPPQVQLIADWVNQGALDN